MSLLFISFQTYTVDDIVATVSFRKNWFQPGPSAILQSTSRESLPRGETVNGALKAPDVCNKPPLCCHCICVIDHLIYIMYAPSKFVWLEVSIKRARGTSLFRDQWLLMLSFRLPLSASQKRCCCHGDINFYNVYFIIIIIAYIIFTFVEKIIAL